MGQGEIKGAALKDGGRTVADGPFSV